MLGKVDTVILEYFKKFKKYLETATKLVTLIINVPLNQCLPFENPFLEWYKWGLQVEVLVQGSKLEWQMKLFDVMRQQSFFVLQNFAAFLLCLNLLSNAYYFIENESHALVNSTVKLKGVRRSGEAASSRPIHQCCKRFRRCFYVTKFDYFICKAKDLFDPMVSISLEVSTSVSRNKWINFI